MNELENTTERDFLNILFYNQDKCFDLIQIKPKYFINPLHKKMLEKMIDVYEKDKVITITNLLEKEDKITCDKIINFFAEDDLPIIEIYKQFISDQVIILNNYKKVVINDLLKKLNQKELTIDDYLRKMSVISEINIKTGTEPISEEELNKNISKSSVLIDLKYFPCLNKLLKLEQGDFLTIGASTGVGKSGLLLNFMNDLMEDYQCIYFNMEMTKSTICRRMVSINSDVPLEFLENPKTEYQKKLIQESIKRITANKVVLEHKATSLEDIRNIIRIAKNDKKHTIIFLDHIGLIKSVGARSQYEQMTEVAKKLRQICLDYDCTIISACQLNRASYNSEDLSISMLKDSGELENSSSKVLLLYRDKEDKERNKDSYLAKMCLEIVKNREGPHGRVIYEYDKTKQIFKEERSV